MDNMAKLDTIIAKYTKIIHPKDLGNKTSILESVLYSMSDEIRDEVFKEVTEALKIAFNLPVDNFYQTK